MSIDQVFARAAEHNLARHGYLSVFLEADGRFLLVAVIEHDGDAGLGNACLPALVDEVLHISKLISGQNGTFKVAQIAKRHTCRFCARTVLMFVIPKTKHIASRMFDLPLPLSPVIELKVSSHPLMTVRTAYDLKPSMTTSTTLILRMVSSSSPLSRVDAPLRCLSSKGLTEQSAFADCL